MAKIIGNNGAKLLVEMDQVEAKKVFADPAPAIGLDKNINVIYNQLIWLINNKTKLRAFADALRNSADNLEAAVNTADV